ncbi:MAG: aminomethyl transferase family protein [SAR202 cluster bacterium]|nr:aminomethyl transferase family protein [SAR202 cluster bacterium]
MATISASGSVDKEYRAARESAAVFDFSSWGRIKATGADTLDLLNRLSTNKTVGLKPGQGAPTILTSDKGRVIDLIYVYNLGLHILLVTSPGAAKPVMEWIDKYTIMDDCVLEDVSQKTSLLTVVGPRAAEVVDKMTALDVSNLPAFGSAKVSISGTEGWVLRWDQAEIKGYQLVTPSDATDGLRQAAVSAGATLGSAQSWDMLRVEAGIPAYDKELGERFNPLEAGLIGAIDFAKGCYVGQEVIARLDTYKKVQRRLVSLSFENADDIKEGAQLIHEGQSAGEVTSVAKLPGKHAGLGYVREGLISSGARLAIQGRGYAVILRSSQLFGPSK